MNISVSKLAFFAILLLTAETALSQAQRADFSLTLSPNPSNYPGFPYNGTITARLTYPTNASEVPANKFSVIVTAGGAVVLNLSGYSPPAGWKIDTETSNQDEVHIYNENALTDIEGALDFVIPTVSTGAGLTVFGGDIGARDPAAWYDDNTANNLPTAFVFVANNPLPVKLSSFVVTSENTTALLSWTTTEEANSSHFEIQHSPDAKSWKEIGRIKSNGTSNSLQRYGFTHAAPSGGINYYRLKMTDLDGSFDFSMIKSLEFPRQTTTEVFPNPARDMFSIRSDNWEQVTGVALYNGIGVAAYRSGNRPEKEIKTGNLAPGMYILKITRAHDKSETHRIVIGK